MPTPEGKVKKQIKDYLKTLAPDCWFFCPQGGAYGRAGIPDIVGCYRGFFFAIEVKAPGRIKNVTKLQHIALTSIVESGGMCFLTESVEDVKGMITDFDGQTRF